MIQLGPNGIVVYTHVTETRPEPTRHEDGAGSAADDVFPDDVVFPSTVRGDGGYARRFPGGLYGNSSRLPQREEYSHVHPKAVRYFKYFFAVRLP